MKVKNRGLYWALIGTFTLLYLAVAFVSTLHAITFFQLANASGLAILLGSAYEIGQASVLFGILMSENRNRVLSWVMMLLLTALQITANVYASFKYMDVNGGNNWTYWQRSILFWVQADSPEMYKVIISWVQGALLPLVSLGMTALVADNIRLARGEHLQKNDDNDSDDEKLEDEIKPLEMGVEPIKDEKLEEIIENEVKRRLQLVEEKLPPTKEEQLSALKNSILNNVVSLASDKEQNPVKGEGGIKIIEPQIELDLQLKNPEMDPFPIKIPFSKEYIKSIDLEKRELIEALNNFDTKKDASKEDLPIVEEKIPEINLPIETKTINPQPRVYKKKKDKFVAHPSNTIQGWHLMKEFIDNDHNVFQKGKFIKNDHLKTPTPPKKA
jgi:hypothetical protein